MKLAEDAAAAALIHLTMKLCTVLDVVSKAVLTTKLIQPRPVNNINKNGKNMYKIIVRLA